MIRTLTCIAVLSLAAVTAQSASAADAYAPRASEKVTVSLKGSDLTDSSRVRGRLAAAAHAVCASEGATDVFTAEADRACEQQAMNDALSQLNVNQTRSMTSPTGASTTLAAADGAAGSR